MFFSLLSIFFGNKCRWQGREGLTHPVREPEAASGFVTPPALWGPVSRSASPCRWKGRPASCGSPRSLPGGCFWLVGWDSFSPLPFPLLCGVSSSLPTLRVPLRASRAEPRRAAGQGQLLRVRAPSSGRAGVPPVKATTAIKAGGECCVPVLSPR